LANASGRSLEAYASEHHDERTDEVVTGTPATSIYGLRAASFSANEMIRLASRSARAIELARLTEQFDELAAKRRKIIRLATGH